MILFLSGFCMMMEMISQFYINLIMLVCIYILLILFSSHISQHQEAILVKFVNYTTSILGKRSILKIRIIISHLCKGHCRLSQYICIYVTCIYEILGRISVFLQNNCRGLLLLIVLSVEFQFDPITC